MEKRQRSYSEIIEKRDGEMYSEFADKQREHKARRTRIVEKLANVAAFANKFASDEFKNEVDKVSRQVFESHNIEHKLASIIDDKVGGLTVENNIWDNDTATFSDIKLDKSKIDIPKDLRDFIDTRLQKEYREGLQLKEEGISPMGLYSKAEHFLSHNMFDADGNIVAQNLIDEFYEPYYLSKFIDDIGEAEVYDLERSAEAEGYDNTRLRVYHDGRIEPGFEDINVYLDNIPRDDMEKLSRASENQAKAYSDLLRYHDGESH